MSRFLKILVVLGCTVGVTQSGSAADWSQGEWQILSTSPSDSLLGVQGLDCSDGVTHLVLTVKDSTGAYRFRYHQWSRMSGYLGEQDWPDDLRYQYRHMNYAGVDRLRSAFLSRTTLWQLTSTGWDSVYLAEEDGWPYPLPQCFSFDSLGALHYVLQGELGGTYAYYRRTGGGQSARVDTFYNGFEYGFSVTWSTRIWNPRWNSVVIGLGVDDALNIRPNFWTVEFYHAVANGPFVHLSDLDSDYCYYGAPRIVLSPRGDWIYGLHRATWDCDCPYYYAQVWTGSDGLPATSYAPIYGTVTYRVFDNPHESRFEFAGVLEDENPAVVQFMVYDTPFETWIEDTTLVMPTDHQTLHVMVDSLGRGHLFTVDSTHLWYFGSELPDAAQDPVKSLADNFSLSAYPNPFNPSTAISFTVPRAQHVALFVFDITGREAVLLTNQYYPAGEHRVTFDGSALPSGIYFARMDAGDFRHTQKLVLLK